MTRHRNTPPPTPAPGHLVSIPPGLRRAVRDGVITPTIATELTHYLPDTRHQSRAETTVDAPAATIGKVIALLIFIAIAAAAIAALAAGAAWLIRTITG